MRSTGAVAALTPTDTGTGLHDTILAAYRSAQAAYREGTPSHAVVFTDGRNEADNPSLSLDQLRDGVEGRRGPAQAGQPRRHHLRRRARRRRRCRRRSTPVQGYVDRLATADEVGAAFIHLAAGGLHG